MPSVDEIKNDAIKYIEDEIIVIKVNETRTSKSVNPFKFLIII